MKRNMNDDELFAHGYSGSIPFHASIKSANPPYPSLVLCNPQLSWIGRHPHPRLPAPSNELGLRKIITWDMGFLDFCGVCFPG